jgi:hypothetical protein
MRSEAVDKIAKRTELQSDCTNDNLAAIQTVLSNCQMLATNAAADATSNETSRFNEYFMTTDNSTRAAVAARLEAVAADCNATAVDETRIYCTDVYNGCASNVLAYTLPAYNYMLTARCSLTTCRLFRIAAIVRTRRRLCYTRRLMRRMCMPRGLWITRMATMLRLISARMLRSTMRILIRFMLMVRFEGVLLLTSSR